MSNDSSVCPKCGEELLLLNERLEDPPFHARFAFAILSEIGFWVIIVAGATVVYAISNGIIALLFAVISLFVGSVFLYRRTPVQQRVFTYTCVKCSDLLEIWGAKFKSGSKT